MRCCGCNLTAVIRLQGVYMFPEGVLESDITRDVDYDEISSSKEFITALEKNLDTSGKHVAYWPCKSHAAHRELARLHRCVKQASDASEQPPAIWFGCAQPVLPF